LLGGRIVMTPPAHWPHGGIGANVVRLIAGHTYRSKLGTVCDSSAGYELPTGDVVAPDVSFLSNERLAVGPAPAEGELLRIVPDLVVEILSPSTRRRDLNEKREIYERNGVLEYWLVDAVARTVTVLARTAAGFDAGESYLAGRIASRVLPDLDATVEEVFAR
jgi:Uma2 family endonuclease